MVTRRPRALSRRPRLEAVSPLPRLEATPPVTKRCLVDAGRDEYDAAAKGRLPWSVRSGEAAGPRAIRISAGHHQNLHQHHRDRRQVLAQGRPWAAGNRHTCAGSVGFRGSAPGPAPRTGAAKLAEGRRAAPANRPNWPKANAAAPVT